MKDVKSMVTGNKSDFNGFIITSAQFLSPPRSRLIRIPIDLVKLSTPAFVSKTFIAYSKGFTSTSNI